MEKLIISKKLAKDVYEWQTSVKVGIDKIAHAHSNELGDLMKKHNFKTIFQVTAYLLGGQSKVYEIKKEEESYSVVWLTGIKQFFSFKTKNIENDNEYEVVIHVYDTQEEAEEAVEELNNSL